MSTRALSEKHMFLLKNQVATNDKVIYRPRGKLSYTEYIKGRINANHRFMFENRCLFVQTGVTRKASVSPKTKLLSNDKVIYKPRGKLSNTEYMKRQWMLITVLFSIKDVFLSTRALTKKYPLPLKRSCVE